MLMPTAAHNTLPQLAMPNIGFTSVNGFNGTNDHVMTPQTVRPAVSPGPRYLSRSIHDLVRPHRKIEKICCIGAGYVGGPTCAVIANKNPQIKVTVADLNSHRINAWNSTSLPIYEPNLPGVVFPARDGIDGRLPNLFFTTNIEDAVREADLIFVSVNTPTKMTGLGAGSASDLGYLESAIRTIAAVAETDKIIVEKSTVPCRTADSIRDILAATARPDVRFDILSNPEFLAEGTAVSDLLYPDRILIGSLSDEEGLAAAAALADVYAAWVPDDRIITMNLWSSELAKLAANALLAQRISSINALSAVCEATGADIDEVSHAVGLDKRIGPYMLKSSVGFGGSCFKKDILSLVYLSETLNLPQVASYWRSVVDLNEWQKDRFTKHIISSLYNTLSHKKVAVFGFAYKKNTGDTRESAAISIVHRLLAERAKVSIYDPQVTEEQIRQDLRLSGESPHEILQQCVSVTKNPYEACTGASAVVVATEWDEFRFVESAQSHVSNGNTAHMNGTNGVHSSVKHVTGSGNSQTYMDWRRVKSVMSQPAFLFDGRNVVDRRQLEKLGFRVEGIGKGRDDI